MQASKTKEFDATKGPLLKKIILFAIPIILTGVLQQLYNAADMIVVGRFAQNGETSLAAVGTTGALTNLMIGLFMGLSVGAGVSVAHHVGERRYDQVSRVIHTSITLSVVIGVVIATVGYFAAPTLLMWMGVPEGAVHENATLYIRIIFMGFPANLLYNYCASMLRSAGDAKHPLLFLSISGIVNVILNVILVAFFHLDVAGVAIATVTANYISCAMILLYMGRSKDFMHFSPRKLCIDRQKLRKILYIGIPSGIHGCLFSFSNVLIQSAVNSFGDTMMAGAATASNIESFIYVSMNALYHVALTFVGQNIGAKTYQNIKKIVIYCVCVVSVVGLVLGVSAILFNKPLVGLFAPGNEAVRQAAMIKLSFVALPYFLCGVMDVLCGAMRAMGKSITSMIVSLCGACGTRVLWLQTVFKLFPTPACVFLSYPISWSLTALAYAILLSIYLPRLTGSKKAKTV